MLNLFAMADDLEQAEVELIRVKHLIGVLAEGLFKNNELGEYYQQYEAVLDAALDKVMEQNKVVHDIAACLYALNREMKGA